MTGPVLELRDVTKRYGMRRRPVWALAGVSLTLGQGETLGVVGESGSGKSTIGRIAAGLEAPTTGSALLDGRPVTQVLGTSRVQMVFQDPGSSLNPLLSVARSVREPLEVVTKAPSAVLHRRALDSLVSVGIDGDMADRLPSALSGGQRQRASIGRALVAVSPVVVCDEAVTALDVSIRAQILNLLRELQDEHGISYLFISHDLSTVAYMSDRILVMYLGKVMEVGTSSQIRSSPAHPYTYALMSAVPALQQGNERRVHVRLSGEPPSAAEPPSGCRFHTRCPMAEPRCVSETPPLAEISKGHYVACHFAPIDEARMTGSGGLRLAGAL